MAECLNHRDGLYLHILPFDGSQIAAFVSNDPNLNAEDPEINRVFDAEVVESKNQALLWFEQAIRERPWEKSIT